MRKREEDARLTVGAARRAEEPGTNHHESPESTLEFITFRAGGQIQIADLLMHGADHALPLRHLVQLTGMKSRDLRRQIQRERRAGVPILSDNVSGYFLPASDFERQRFVQSMRGRAREIEAIAAAVEGAEV